MIPSELLEEVIKEILNEYTWEYIQANGLDKETDSK